MVRVISTFFNVTLKWSIRQTFSIIRFALPIAIWLVFAVLGISFRLSLLALVASFRGVRPVARRVAQDWTAIAVDKGFPTLWELTLVEIFYVLAIATILVGWAIIGFTTFVTADIAYHLIF